MQPPHAGEKANGFTLNSQPSSLDGMSSAESRIAWFHGNDLRHRAPGRCSACLPCGRRSVSPDSSMKDRSSEDSRSQSDGECIRQTLSGLPMPV